MQTLARRIFFGGGCPDIGGGGRKQTPSLFAHNSSHKIFSAGVISRRFSLFRSLKMGRCPKGRGGKPTKPLSRLPQGEKLKPSSNQTLPWKTVTAINRPAPFPFGKRRAEPVEAGGGIGPTDMPINHHPLGEVSS